MNSSAAASMWQSHLHRIISRKLGLQSLEYDEITLLKLKADKLKEIRKKLVNERYD